MPAPLTSHQRELFPFSMPCASRRGSNVSGPAGSGCCARPICPGARALADDDHGGRIETHRWQELETLSRQSEWLQRGEALLLFGPSGVGKTHLAFGIALAQIGSAWIRPAAAVPPRAGCRSC